MKSNLLLVFLFFISCSLFEENPRDDVTIGYDGPIMVDGEASWSPNGEWIAFTHISDQFQSDTLKDGLYLIRPDGSNLILFQEFGSLPDWSPDGQWMVFNIGGQIYKKELATDSLVQLTSEGRNFFPTWSPEGSEIAYDSNTDSESGLSFIWKMNKNGLNNQRIAFTPDEGEVRNPFWRGNYIFHYRYIGIDSPEIFRMNPDGSNSRRLTFNDVSDRNPKYSVPSEKILFDRSQWVWSMNEDGSNQKRLIKNSGNASWSPDGSKIVFTRYTEFPDISINDLGFLWIMDADGENPRQLTEPME